MNVALDHRADSDVAGLVAAQVRRRSVWVTFGFFLGLGAALALPAQEVTVPTKEKGTGTTPTDVTRSTRGAADSGRTTAPAPPAVNPLEGYLADWMRPRDHALLRKDTSATPTAAESWRRLATTSPAARKPATKVAPSANPYIEAMNAAANPSPATAVTTTPSAQITSGLPSPVTPSATASLAEPEAPPPPPATRYQPPPSSDAKYFPQLKRF